MHNRKRQGWTLLVLLLPVAFSGRPKDDGSTVPPDHPPLFGEAIINSSELSGGIIRSTEYNICIGIDMIQH